MVDDEPYFGCQVKCNLHDMCDTFRVEVALGAYSNAIDGWTVSHLDDGSVCRDRNGRW